MKTWAQARLSEHFGVDGSLDFGPHVVGYCPTDLGPSGSGKGLLPAADEHRHGEEYDKKIADGPPKSKPPEAILQHADVLEVRRRELGRQRRQIEAGKQPFGIFAARDLGAVQRSEWSEVRRNRGEARRERLRVQALNPLLLGKAAENSGGPLCSAWQLEDQGWTRVKVIMDSGAAESVCPRSMAPSFKIEDSIASRAGVYYTSANGGKIMNLGQQHIPVLLANGSRSVLTFQVADVSRPPMSIARLCEMGNRVLFGANGGVILNLQTGDVTPFVKEEGVYTFELWIPPASEAPFGRPQ